MMELPRGWRGAVQLICSFFHSGIDQSMGQCGEDHMCCSHSSGPSITGLDDSQWMQLGETQHVVV